MDLNRSNIFQAYRSVGSITGCKPSVVKNAQKPQDTRIITIVDNTFLTYSSNLSLLSVSIPHEEDINFLIADARYTYSASGKSISIWAREGRQLIAKLECGHKSLIKTLIKVDRCKIASLDNDNLLMVWDVDNLKMISDLAFDDGIFDVTSICHPVKYKNKLLFGSKQGPLELWNLITKQRLYKFKGWDSGVSCIVRSSIEDVVAVGLEDGHVHVVNLKYDESVMKIYQEYGIITSMSFRLDGLPYLVTTSRLGHIMIWNLEMKRLSTQIRNAHAGDIVSSHFLQNEALMVTSGSDNSIKVWSMDMSDGGGSLLHLRSGHSEPPTQIEFYGSKDFNLLSSSRDCTMKMFHIHSERLSRNLGTARFNPKSKSRGASTVIKKLPPITRFAFETAKEKSWDNIAACHENSAVVTTWNYDKCKMGDHIIAQPSFDKHGVYASAICLSPCGNYVIIGFSNGLIYKYNIQSGQFRGYYESDDNSDHKAHEGIVSGLTVDGLNKYLISAGDDFTLRLWNLRSNDMIAKTKCESAITLVRIHKDTNMLAVAMVNNSISIMDLDNKTTIRKFAFRSAIIDMTFSPNCRWLIVSYDDRSIRTWDLMEDQMVDAFSTAKICTSLSMSPNGLYLATAHQGSLSINVWSNNTIFHLYLPRPIDPDADPIRLDEPKHRSDDRLDDELEADEVVAAEDDDIDESSRQDRYQSPDQLSSSLITLSGLPASRTKNLLRVGELREHQRIEEEERKTKNVKVPFFIPVKDGLNPRLDHEAIKKLNASGIDDPKNIPKSQINYNLDLLSPIAKLLVSSNDNYEKFISEFSELGNSATDAEIRMLSSDTCGSNEVMVCFLKAMDSGLHTNKNFDLIISWLALFLKIHWDLIQNDHELKKICQNLIEPVSDKCDRVGVKFTQIFCVLNFVRKRVR